MSPDVSKPDSGYQLAIGFGTTVAMWAVGYVSRLPPAVVPNWALFGLLLGCIVAGGFLAGRHSPRGWRAGAYAGLTAGFLNLIILQQTLAFLAAICSARHALTEDF